jgi:hypothetical protein
MSAHTSIKYNNTDVFDGLGPTPFVAVSKEPVRYNNKWGVIEKFTLEGQIVAKCADFEALLIKKAELLERLGADFGALEILDGNDIVISKPFCRIRSINFPNSKFVDLIDYSIEIESYNQSLFHGVFGVINPSNKVSYTENPDGTVTVTHEIKAEGFNTSSGPSNALSNAISYVKSQDSLALAISNYFVDLASGTGCKSSVNEVIDRFNATYSVTSNYTFSKKGTTNLKLSLTSEISYDEQVGIYQIGLSGDVTSSCEGATLEISRDTFQSLNLLLIARNQIKRIFPDVELNPYYISRNIEEDQIENNVNFSISFDSDVSAGLAHFDYSTSVSYDNLSDRYDVSLQGSVVGRRGQKLRWENVKDFVESINPFPICQAALAKEYPSIILDANPQSISKTYDERNGTVSISAQYQDRKNVYDDFSAFEYAINMVPPINYKIPKNTLSGNIIVDINTKLRGSVAVGGTAETLTTDDKSETLRAILLSIVSEITPKHFIESLNISIDKDENGWKYSFDIETSFSYNDYPQFLFDIN